MENITPTPAEIIAFREQLQIKKKLGITAGQDYCAGMLPVTRRAWQQYERGERRMSLALWRLANFALSERKKKS